MTGLLERRGHAQCGFKANEKRKKAPLEYAVIAGRRAQPTMLREMLRGALFRHKGAQPSLEMRVGPQKSPFGSLIAVTFHWYWVTGNADRTFQGRGVTDLHAVIPWCPSQPSRLFPGLFLHDN